MSKIPKQVYTLKNNVIFIISMVVWVLLFATIYTPTFGFLPDDLDNPTVPEAMLSWYRTSSYCIPIICAILFAVLSISRLMLWGGTRTNRMSEVEYAIWHVAEIIVICLFEDLYLSLFFSEAYFALLPNVLLIAFLVLLPPYSVYWLYVEKREKEMRLAEANETLVQLRNGLDGRESSIIKFVDEKGTVRLVVNSDLVYTVEAAGNYVTILYDNNGLLTRFALRSTLKAIEDVCLAHGIVRCHRSWFVNLQKIRLLRHEPDGIYAEINGQGIPDLPVSRSYASSVIQQLSK